VVAGPLRFEVPLLASIDIPATLLTAAALVAVFRFKAGTLWVIAACGAAGLLYGMMIRP
jgi:chromate transporter